ncbi:MAG: acyltransferase [Nitrospiraceae bacterium]|nr:acyltransferase [Nitrospiraceae bacterium]
MMPRIVRRLVARLGVILEEADEDIAKASLPEFGNRPKNLVIETPRRIINPHLMFLGDDIRLGPGAMLNAITIYPPGPWMPPNGVRQQFAPRITIGNRVTSASGLLVCAMKEIVIEDDVTFDSNVLLTDGMHGYETAMVPYKFQNMTMIAPIIIKKGSWIGQNVVIMPGVIIGECSVIGANSVVTKSVPGRCSAEGSPAKILNK